VHPLQKLPSLYLSNFFFSLGVNLSFAILLGEVGKCALSQHSHLDH
jgi:hypothetical protein